MMETEATGQELIAPFSSMLFLMWSGGLIVKRMSRKSQELQKNLVLNLHFT